MYKASASPLAEPVAEASAKTQSHMMLSSDRWDAKEDIVSWQDRMIASGKMYRPNVTSASIDVNHLQSRGVFDFSLSSIACGVLIGGTDTYVERRDYFCNTMISADNTMYRTFGVIFQEEESIIMEIALGLGNYFTNEFIANTACFNLFDALERSCPSGGGATATVNISFDNGENVSGSMESLHYELDNGAQCPANPLETQYCELRRL